MNAQGILIAILCAAVAAGPVAAQNDPQIGSRLGKRQYIRSEHDPKASVRAGHKMAGCTYNGQKSQVRGALAALDPADAMRRLNALQPRGACMNLTVRDDRAEAQQVNFTADIYRGMLAEAALRQDFARRQLQPLPRQQTYSRPWFAATSRPQAVDEMGACVADTNPAGVQALLVTTAETAEEATAVSQLMPSLGPCLTTGAKLNANRQSLRAALAEALYQRFTLPAATPPTPAQ